MINKPAIQEPLTKKEIIALVDFLAYHLGYVPKKYPTAIFCKTAKEYAQRYETYKVKEPEVIDEINNEVSAFFDHWTDTIVFQGFSYHESAEIPRFIIPMGTVIHELIHFFQYATGSFGTYSILYEGTNEILAALFVDDFRFDYDREVGFAFNLIMELNGHNIWAAIQWMRVYTLHSHKNRFIHRQMKQSASFSRYQPKKLMSILEGACENGDLSKIDNEETRKILTRYSLTKIKQLLKTNREVIKL